MKIKNSTILLIGVIILLSGIYLGAGEYFKTKKEKAFTEMNLLLYKSETPEEKEGPVEPTPEPVPETNENTTPVERTYDFIAELEIPKINLKRGLVSMDSPYNNVDNNITIIGGSKMPDTPKSNLILAAHSGYCYFCYFNQLYKVSKGDTASLYYKGTKYTYQVVNIYNVPKNGQVAVRRNKTKTVMTLITCTKNSDTQQTVYILELINTQKY